MGFKMSTYLNEGYYTENQNGRLVPKHELYIDWPKEIAKELSLKKMTSASLRKFFNSVKALENLLNDEMTFENEVHRLYKLDSFASYYVNKDQGSQEKLPYEFSVFIENNIKEASKSYKHFLTFLDHFQCVVAYFKGKK